MNLHEQARAETDDLLDEATRLAAEFNRQFPITAATLRALVERVQQVESDLRVARVGEALGEVAVRERDQWHQAALTATAGESRAERERDEARGKLDAVHALAEDTSESVNNDWGWGYDAAMERVLAILDGKAGD